MESVNKIDFEKTLAMSSIKKLTLRAIELFGGFRLLQWKHRHQPLILMYHRVINNELIGDITPDLFEQQLLYINKHFRVVPMQQLLDELANNKVEPFTLAVTFDDGHFDFYENTWPLLKKYNIPACLYITTGFVSETHWLWPDLLKYILDNAKNKTLSIDNLAPLSTSKEHFQNAWHALGDHCLTLLPKDRHAFLMRLAAIAGIEPPHKPLKPFSAVSWEQLKIMHKEGLDIGSHTVTHPILSALTHEEIYDELAFSAKEISEKIGVFPAGICYPNGRPEDINNDVIECAQKIGYSYGIMARKTPVNIAHKFKLGRLAANKNFNYFKWSLSRRESDVSSIYLQ